MCLFHKWKSVGVVLTVETFVCLKCKKEKMEFVKNPKPLPPLANTK
jgi:hypothetical protein